MDLTKIYCNLSDLKQSEQLKDVIVHKWSELQNITGVFKYKLNVKCGKLLSGDWKLFTELNPDRALLRRLPQYIASLNPIFNENEFNFNKANQQELVVNIKWKESIFTLLINQSPITPYHCLICPRLADNIPQILNKESIEFSLKLLASLDDFNFRIGYNSPGALASVNHLHLHLMFIDKDLSIDRVRTSPVMDNIFKTEENCPLKAFCFNLHQFPDTKEFDSIEIGKIYQIIRMLCQENIPHNLFFSPDRRRNEFAVNVYLFVRKKACVVKDVLALNLAFLEFSGFIPVGDEDLYNSLTEDYVFGKMKTELGNIYEIVEEKILSLFPNN